MAPIIRKMEAEVVKVAPFDFELPSYVDDLYLNICIWDRINAGLDMNFLLVRAGEAVNRVAEANSLPLEKSKHEKLVLRQKNPKN